MTKVTTSISNKSLVSYQGWTRNTIC